MNDAYGIKLAGCLNIFVCMLVVCAAVFGFELVDLNTLPFELRVFLAR